MFSQFMLVGLLLAIGVAGVIWWVLQEFTHLAPAKADGIAVVSGLAVSLLISLINRNLLNQPLQVIIALVVLIISYCLVQLEQKKRAEL